MGKGGGYGVSHSGMSGQAKELDGCGDDADKIHRATQPGQCYLPDVLGGSDAGPAFEAFASAWEAETRTLTDALHQLADKVRLAGGSLRKTDHGVKSHVNGVSVPNTPHDAPSAGGRHSALSSY